MTGMSDEPMTAAQLEAMAAAYEAMARVYDGRPDGEYCEIAAERCRHQADRLHARPDLHVVATPEPTP